MSIGIRNRFVIDNTLPFFYSFSVCENIVYMERCKIRGDSNFRIDRRGYDTDDPLVREERVDVSPAGTEGIFIDTDSPDSNAEDG